MDTSKEYIKMCEKTNLSYKAKRGEMSKIIIIGAGIVGRMAKIMFPEATVLEAKSPNSIYTSELGVCISIVPIPDLVNVKYTRYITIDGYTPTLETINRYKRKITREGDMSYGDYRQFEPEQVVYKQVLPKNLTIRFNTEVTFIDLDAKIVVISENEELKYDYLISTIPLMVLIQISNLFITFKKSASTFFMHRPIYLIRFPVVEEFFIIRENYITDPDTPIYRENTFDGWKNQESLFKSEKALKIFPGKIYPNSHTSFILRDLESYNVYCVGRYAQWDSKLHLWNVCSQLKLLRHLL